MVSTTPVVLMTLVLSLSISATGLADQCPSTRDIYPQQSGSLAAVGGWFQSSEYRSISSVDGPIAVTVKMNPKSGYTVSCIYRSQKGYVVLDKQYPQSAKAPSGEMWPPHICQSAKNKPCDYSCTISGTSSSCQW